MLWHKTAHKKFKANFCLHTSKLVSEQELSYFLNSESLVWIHKLELPQQQQSCPAYKKTECCPECSYFIKSKNFTHLHLVLSEQLTNLYSTLSNNIQGKLPERYSSPTTTGAKESPTVRKLTAVWESHNVMETNIRVHFGEVS